MRVQLGSGAVALVVRYRSPLLCPTHTTSAFPGAIAMALMNWSPGYAEIGGLIACHEGELALTSFVRHNDAPPASIRRGLFGSSTKGAMKFALPPASAIPLKMNDAAPPPSVLRCSCR